jgi:hypothetical protein
VISIVVCWRIGVLPALFANASVSIIVHDAR